MGNNRADTLETYLRQRKDLVDEALDAFLPPEDTPPESIFKAVRYSIFAGETASPHSGRRGGGNLRRPGGGRSSDGLRPGDDPHLFPHPR